MKFLKTICILSIVPTIAFAGTWGEWAESWRQYIGTYVTSAKDNAIDTSSGLKTKFLICGGGIGGAVASAEALSCTDLFGSYYVIGGTGLGLILGYSWNLITVIVRYEPEAGPNGFYLGGNVGAAMFGGARGGILRKINNPTERKVGKGNIFFAGATFGLSVDAKALLIHLTDVSEPINNTVKYIDGKISPGITSGNASSSASGTLIRNSVASETQVVSGPVSGTIQVDDTASGTVRIETVVSGTVVSGTVH